MRKFESPEKARKKKKKTRTGNLTWKADKNLRKQAKVIKEGKDAGTCREYKKKATKNNNKTWGNKTERTGERREIKEISVKGKTVQTKKDIRKQREEILSISGWRTWKPDTRETEQFSSKIWQPREEQKSQTDKQYDKRIRRARRRLESGNTHRFTQNNTKKVSNLETPGHDEIHGFWFKKFTSIHDKQALEMNRCQQEDYVPKRMTKGKITFIQKDSHKWTDPNNYRSITCLPMIWKILTAQIREEIYYSLTSNEFSPEEQEEFRSGSKGILKLFTMRAIPDGKSSYVLDWLQKGI